MREPPPPSDDAYEAEIDRRRDERRIFGDAPVLGPVHALSSFEARGDVPDPRIRGVPGVDTFRRPVTLERRAVPAGFERVVPRPEHVRQGALGDCWLLASLASLAHTHPEFLRANMRQVGPVTFRIFGELVDTDFASIGGRPLFADGSGDALWVALVEKRFAQRLPLERPQRYASINGGFEATAFAAMGLLSDSYWPDGLSRAEWTAAVVAAVRAGRPVCAGVDEDINAEAIQVVGHHAYSVLGARTTASGSVELQLRNPWGTDANAKADGVFWVPADVLYDANVEITAATVP